MQTDGTIGRRAFLVKGAGFAAGPALEALPRLRVTGFDLLPVRATERTVWLIVRVRTNAGLTGLGEASDAFGFANTTKQDAARKESALRGFFELIDGKSPLEISAFRQQAEPVVAKGGLVAATAFSAIEQAKWDLAGKSLDVPVYTLFGGKIRDSLHVYANFRLLEFQWGEVDWRRDVLNPPETFENGSIRVPERPGLGIEP